MLEQAPQGIRTHSACFLNGAHPRSKVLVLIQDRPSFNQLARRLKKIKDGGRERTWSTESMGLKHRTQSVGSDARSSEPEPEPEPEIQVVAAQPRASNGGSAAPVVSAKLA